jgi:hypothetical protein
MIPLDAVDKVEKAVNLVDFPAGLHGFGAESRTTLADKLAQAPGESAVLVANPSDQAIYYYSEGMAAPMGNFDLKPHQPLAVMVVDRSLRERKTGLYETTAQLGPPGLYTFAFFMDSPRVVHCFDNVRVAANPALKAAPASPSVSLRPVPVTGPIHLGETVKLRFRLTGRPAVPDLRVITYLASGTNRTGYLAKRESDGTYAVDFTPDEAGIYIFAAGSDSLGLKFGDAPSGTIEVLAAKGN